MDPSKILGSRWKLAPIALASKLWITDLSYGVRIISDALVMMPEVSSVNLGGVALLAK